MSSQTEHNELSLLPFADASLVAMLNKSGAEDKLDLNAPCFWLGSAAACEDADTNRLIAAVEAEDLQGVQRMAHLGQGPAVYAVLFHRKGIPNKYDVLVFRQPLSFTGRQECLFWKRLEREYVVHSKPDAVAAILPTVRLRWWHILLGVFCPKTAARLIVPDLPADPSPSLRR